MAETGDASDCLARLAGFDSNVCSRMNFHNNAIHHYTGINNALQSVIKEKEKMQLERTVLRTARLQLMAATEELTTRNEERAAEIQSLKRRLQASKASDTSGLQGSGCDHNLSGVQKRSVQKGKQQDDGHAGMNNLEQDLSTELGGVKDESRITNAKLIKRTYGREDRVMRVKDSAVKFRRSPRLVAMEEPESVGVTTKPTRAKAAKFDVGKASRTLADSLQDDAGYVGVSSASSATPAALHTIGQECGLSPDELQAVMLLSSSMHRCSP